MWIGSKLLVYFLALLSPNATAGTRGASATFADILAKSEAVAIIDVSEVEESAPYARSRTMIHDVRAQFTWTIIVRKCPYLELDRTEVATVEFARREYDAICQPGQYLAFLFRQAPGHYKIATATLNDGFFSISDGAFRLPRHWRNPQDEELPELSTLAEIREMIRTSTIPDHVQHFNASSIIAVSGIERADSNADCYRLTFATRNKPGDRTTTERNSYSFRVRGYCQRTPDVRRQLVSLIQAPLGEYVISGKWRSGYFEIDEIVSKTTGETVLKVTQ